jgi:hypothetical protein
MERTKASELSAMLAKYNREMADLEEALHVSRVPVRADCRPRQGP